VNRDKAGLEISSNDAHIQIVLTATQGKVRGGLSIVPDGSAGIQIADADNRVIWKAP
jgi:hypothetical protein